MCGWCGIEMDVHAAQLSRLEALYMQLRYFEVLELESA